MPMTSYPCHISRDMYLVNCSGVGAPTSLNLFIDLLSIAGRPDSGAPGINQIPSWVKNAAVAAPSRPEAASKPFHASTTC